MDIITIAAPAQAEFTEKKSRFIGYISPAADEQAAQAFLQEIRARHRDATHNCYAWQAGANAEFQRSSDDGEPSGTAGRPILEVIRGAGLTNVVIVVTRYFGGILLGTGGLVRAYTQAAQQAVQAAELVRLVPARSLALSLTYADWPRLEPLLAGLGCRVEDVRFTDKVDVRLLAPLAASEGLPARLADVLGKPVQPVWLNEQVQMAQPLAAE